MQQFDIKTSSGRALFIEAYKSAILENEDYISFKTFCDSHGISDYRKLLWWCRAHKISIKGIQRLSQSEPHPGKLLTSSIVQIRPASMPRHESSLLTNLNISFPDGVNLSLQECSVENMANLLVSYRSRCKAAGGL